MKRVVHFGLVAMLATQALVIGRTQDVGKILADVRAALGGEAKLADVRTLTVEGRSTRPAPDGTSRASNFDMAFELPGKFSKKDVLANMNGMEISRTAGFNGDGLVEIMDTPPQMGGMVFIRPAAGGSPTGAEPTPEELATRRQAMLSSNKKDFARLTLGMFATSFPAYPLEFSYGGVAQAPEGQAHVIDVKGADNFVAKLFVDTRTHLPLMLSWMDKEPLQMTMTGGPGVPMQVMQGGGGHGGGMTQTMTRGGPGGASMGRGGTPMTPEEAAKARAEMDERMREAQANRRTVEFRMFYADYKMFDGVRLPSRIQRMVDGNPTEELEFERVKVNGRVDPKKFEIVK